jgi:hypothetical protein
MPPTLLPDEIAQCNSCGSRDVVCKTIRVRTASLFLCVPCAQELARLLLLDTTPAS